MSEAKPIYKHWIETVVDDLVKRGDVPTVLSTAKTPSGPIHIGISRELVYCSVFEKLLEERGVETDFIFTVDDMDSIKKFPPGVPEAFMKHTEYIGKPMVDVPCPYGDCENWGKHYAQELIDTFNDFGLFPRVIWAHKLYMTKEMKDAIRISLKNVETIRQILKDIMEPTLSGSQLEAFRRELPTWYPCLVVCEQCGLLKPTVVTGYDPNRDTVSYTCSACGYSGEMSISQGRVKLRWRVDWAAKWAIFRVSCEPAGKDHCVKGGAYDTGEAICQKVFGWKGPYRVPYEWFLLGVHAMKTHKGISFTWPEWLAVAPPEVLRYMVLREDPRKHISFEPERIPQLIDEFERAEQIYFDHAKASNSIEERNLKLIYPFCIPNHPPEALPLRLPYRFAVILSQLDPLLGKEGVRKKAITVTKKLYKKVELTETEILAIEKTLERARYWVDHYAPDEMKVVITPTVSQEIIQKLSERQRLGIKLLVERFASKEWTEQELQNEIFNIGNQTGIKTKIFEAVYLIFLGKPFGPRLAPFLLSLDQNFVIQRLKQAAEPEAA